MLAVSPSLLAAGAAAPLDDHRALHPEAGQVYYSTLPGHPTRATVAAAAYELRPIQSAAAWASAMPAPTPVPKVEIDEKREDPS
jgi:hypothetical protein